MTRHWRCGKSRRRLPFVLIFAWLLTLVTSLPAFTQAGQQEPPPPPPKQEPPPKSGGHDSGGGVSTGVDVNIGDLIGLFRKHVKIHLDASAKQTQVGVPIEFKTTVTPNARGLSYEFHLSKDKDTPGFQQTNPALNYSYSAPGEYKATVVVYQAGKKVGTSNEVKIKVQPYSGETVANKTPPPPDQVPPKPVPGGSNADGGQTQPTTTTTAVEPVKPQVTNPPISPVTNPTIVTETKKNLPPQTKPVVKPTDTAQTGPEVGPPEIPKPATSYSLLLYFDPRLPEVDKPAKFRAELNPQPPPEARVKYCFNWGDGDPTSCQSEPEAKHTYRSKGKYLAAVEAFAAEEKLASRDQKLAASEPVPIEAVQPLWLTLLPFMAVLIAILAAGYATHKVRKMLRGTVTAMPDFGQHSITSEVPQNGAVLRIRCVRSAARSKVTFSGSTTKTQEAASA